LFYERGASSLPTGRQALIPARPVRRASPKEKDGTLLLSQAFCPTTSTFVGLILFPSPKEKDGVFFYIQIFCSTISSFVL
jgi:hypothetical protein